MSSNKKTGKQEPLGPRQCATMEVHHRLQEEFPGFRAKRVAIETFTRGFMERRRAPGRALVKARGPVKIPVVVHVVYKTDEQNISEAQIRSQIDVLNRDYRALNPDRAEVPEVWKELVADVGIEFALATVDPDGKPTNGITRTKTRRRMFTSNDGVKKGWMGGIEPWPTDRYLNIWVVGKLVSARGPLLGYAQFPGGPPETDGVVILHQAFGTLGTATAPYNLGRTTTHEVGHWLNLNHIWGDTNDCSGTDHVDDTPNQLGPNYGAPAFPSVTCNNGPNGDMFMNYMDYVDDGAMHMFTTGQAERMQATLVGFRDGLGKVIEAARADADGEA